MNADDYSPGGEVADLESESDDVSTTPVPEACAGMRLDAALARMFPEHSRSRLQAWLKDGHIRLDGEPRDAKHKVWGGEQVSMEVLTAPQDMAAQAEDIPLNIVFEDDTLIVIDKPVGLVVHPGSGNWSGTLMNGLLHHAPQLAEVPRAGIVHRLDKDTSGLLVVAKTLTAQTALVRQLQARTVRRHYLALAVGQVLQDGLVDAPIGRHTRDRTRMAVVGGGREARTHYVIRERFTRCTLLECRLETGRTHQIRVHMANIAHPLVGDQVYGRKVSGDPRLDSFPRQALHAWRLALEHPGSGEEMAWETPLPQDFEDLLRSLRSGGV
ncbi:MAG: 23S rRNA pseudouridine(1911/1915/1917) synthase RluD [Rhodocyclaceae bacterium]|nr:23S rRNA pseudouridine(1911/1915/1917) synthase RluD [Rhodocyclaceae bacterium]